MGTVGVTDPEITQVSDSSCMKACCHVTTRLQAEV